MQIVFDYDDYLKDRNRYTQLMLAFSKLVEKGDTIMVRDRCSEEIITVSDWKEATKFFKQFLRKKAESP